MKRFLLLIIVIGFGWSVHGQAPCGFTISFITRNASCYFSADGYAKAIAMAALPPVSYKWSNDSTSEEISNLRAGVYICSVTDGNGCVVVDTSVVEQPAELNVIVSTTDATPGQYNGGASVDTIKGGTPPYSYSWMQEGGEPCSGCEGPLIDVPAGAYAIIIADANGCLLTKHFLIGDATAIDEIEKEVIIIYPSPLVDGSRLTIHSSTVSGMEVYDANGRVVFQSKISNQKSEILLPVPAGVYFVKVQSERGSVVKKFIKL